MSPKSQKYIKAREGYTFEKVSLDVKHFSSILTKYGKGEACEMFNMLNLYHQTRTTILKFT